MHENQFPNLSSSLVGEHKPPSKPEVVGLPNHLVAIPEDACLDLQRGFDGYLGYLWLIRNWFFNQRKVDVIHTVAPGRTANTLYHNFIAPPANNTPLLRPVSLPDYDLFRRYFRIPHEAEYIDGDTITKAYEAYQHDPHFLEGARQISEIIDTCPPDKRIGLLNISATDSNIDFYTILSEYHGAKLSKRSFPYSFSEFLDRGNGVAAIRLGNGTDGFVSLDLGNGVEVAKASFSQQTSWLGRTTQETFKGILKNGSEGVIADPLLRNLLMGWYIDRNGDLREIKTWGDVITMEEDFLSGRKELMEKIKRALEKFPKTKSANLPVVLEKFLEDNNRKKEDVTKLPQEVADTLREARRKIDFEQPLTNRGHRT
jgi:hypothetical protein